MQTNDNAKKTHKQLKERICILAQYKSLQIIYSAFIYKQYLDYLYLLKQVYHKSFKFLTNKSVILQGEHENEIHLLLHSSTRERKTKAQKHENAKERKKRRR